LQFVGDKNARRFAVAPEFERVGNQILKQLFELPAVAAHNGKRVVRKLGSRFLNGNRKVLPHMNHRLFQRNVDERFSVCADARVRKQIMNEVLHSLRAVDGVADELVGARIELA
jgi:hypothetical protein